MIDQQRLRNIIGGCYVEDGPGLADNVAIALCSYFSDHRERPDPDPESDESGWGEWVTAKTNAALALLTAAVLKEVERDAAQPSASLRCQSEASVILRSIRGDIEAAYNGLDYLTSIHVATAADPNGGRNLARDAAEIKGRLLQHMKRIDAVVTTSTVNGDSAPAVCNHFPGQQDCEWCRATPSASEVPVEESAACEIERANRVYGRGAHTLMALMQAYERRVRSDCTSQADIDARPWECAEYRAAADYLRKTWPQCSYWDGLMAQVCNCGLAERDHNDD